MSKISHSQVEAWLMCQRRWYYSYALKLEKKQTSTVLVRGTAGHAVIEAYYREILNGGNHHTALVIAKARFAELAARPEGVGDEMLVNGGFKNMSLGQLLFDFYFQHEPFVSQGYEVLAVEYDSELSYDEGSSMPFIVDLILRDPYGKIVVVDHKFIYDFLSDNDVAVSPQIKKYIAALRAQGLPADYGIYNQLRWRKIKDPTSKTQLQTHEFHPNDIEVYRVASEQIAAANQIATLKSLPIEDVEKTVLRVGYKKTCQSCDFMSLCTDDLAGRNTRLTIETDYKPKTRREEATP